MLVIITIIKKYIKDGVFSLLFFTFSVNVSKYGDNTTHKMKYYY